MNTSSVRSASVRWPRALPESPAWRVARDRSDRLREDRGAKTREGFGSSCRGSDQTNLAKFAELATVRQTLLWFLEHGLELQARRPNARSFGNLRGGYQRPQPRTVFG